MKTSKKPAAKLSGASAMLLANPVAQNAVSNYTSSFVSLLANNFSTRFPKAVEAAAKGLDYVEAKLSEYQSQNASTPKIEDTKSL